MLRHAQVALFGTGHAPTTLTGSCHSRPGIACRLVWDLTHNAQVASVTDNFLAGPVYLLLRVGYVVGLALIIRALLHRLINRITERAADSATPQFRNGVSSSLVSGRLRARRRRRAAGRVADAVTIAASGGTDSGGTGSGGTGSGGTGSSTDGGGTGSGGTDGGGSAPEIAAAAANAERALVAERRQQRVRALGSILRSAASVTVFAIAGAVVLSDLGINLAPLLASAGVVGVAIGFGAQNLVRDYLSGVFMLLEDQYGVGDVITVGGETGMVETVSLRITRMRDVNGIVWHVRNGTIEQVGNESQGWARAVIDFPVPYAADLTTIRAVLAQTSMSLWNEPAWRAVMLEEPEVWGAQEVSSSSVTMRVVVKTAPLRQWEVERELRARVKAALDTAGIGRAAGT